MERQTVAKGQRPTTGNNHQHRQSSASGSPLMELQRSVGNLAIQRLISSPYIQTKLQISTSGDPFEQEADRVADTVMRTAAPKAKEEEEEERIQAKPLSSQITRVVEDDAELSSEQSGNTSIQRQEAGGTSTSSTSQVGIPGGESQTPSDQTKIGSDYTQRTDGEFDTFDSRVISREQALAESQVINSAGIFMAAYLARYNELKGKYKLPQDVLDRLSKKAGFTKQFKTSDIVLRQMNAADSQGLAKVTDSNYSHSGIIQVNDGRVWVLDSYPSQKKTGRPGDRTESTELIRFEDFFGDQHGEQITQGLVLRITGMTEPIRANINSLIDFYKLKPTTFDYEFKVDNDQYSLYCSELVWRILVEAGSKTLPPNEFEFTKTTVITVINQLELLIALQKSQKTDTSKSESQLGLAKSKLKDFETATTKELYSPGSLERTTGLEPVTGFTREGKIEGEFQVIIISGTVPNDFWDAPDSYVTYSGGILGSSGKTSTKGDTTTPTWKETIITLEYEELNNITLKLYDEDVLSDDLLATFTADLRPVNPKGQTFVLSNAGATLTVMVKGVDEGKSKGALGPQAPRNTPVP